MVEDILTRQHPGFLKDYMLAKGAKSITIVTLLDKPARRGEGHHRRPVRLCGARRVRGGLRPDYCQQYRNMPYIGVLKPEVYSK